MHNGFLRFLQCINLLHSCNIRVKRLLACDWDESHMNRMRRTNYYICSQPDIL